MKRTKGVFSLLLAFLIGCTLGLPAVSAAGVNLGQLTAEIDKRVRALFGVPVQVTGTPTDGHVLTYDSGTGTWRAEAAAAGGSQTPWTSAIDADGYALTDFGSSGIMARTSMAMKAAGEAAYVEVTNSGTVLMTTTSGKQIEITSSGTAVTGNLSATGDASISGTTSATVTAPIQTWNSATGKTLTSAECRGHRYLVDDSANAVVSFTLPASPTAGDHVWFVYLDSNSGLTINDGGNAFVTLAGSVSSYLHTTRVRSSVHLVWYADEGDGSWSADEITGTWAKDSTTSAGYAYTPTPWTAWTPTGSWSANTTYTGLYRRVGDHEEYQVLIELAGAPTSAALTITPRTTVDETKLLSVTNGGTVYSQVESSRGMADDEGASLSGPLSVLYNHTSNVFEVYTSGGLTVTAFASVTQAAPFAFASGDSLVISWSSPVQ